VCSLEFPDLERDIHQAFAGRLTVIGVATGSFGEDEDTLASFLEQTGVTFDVVWDRDTYGTYDWPAASSPFPRQALLDADGRVVYLASEHRADDLLAAVESVVPAP